MLPKAYLILICLLCLITISPAQKNDKPRKFRVLSFNIHHGSNTNDSFDLHRIAMIINNLEPDLVALQEIDIKTKRTNNRDILAEIASLTGMYACFAKAMDFDNGEYGVGILSKKSFFNSEIIALPGTPGNEPRTAAKVSLPLMTEDSLIFISTHLDYKDVNKDRMLQAERLNALIKRNSSPMILAGDLNAEPDSPEITLLLTRWTAADNSPVPVPTYPSNKPDKKIDYILFYPKDRWKVIETKVIHDSIASDHNALFSVLELK